MTCRPVMGNKGVVVYYREGGLGNFGPRSAKKFNPPSRRQPSPGIVPLFAISVAHYPLIIDYREN